MDTNIKKGRKAVFYVSVHNDGNITDWMFIKGVASGSSKLTVKYFAGSTAANITSKVALGSYKLSNIAAGGVANGTIRVEITASRTAGRLSYKSVALKATSASQTTKTDTVKARATVTG